MISFCTDFPIIILTHCINREHEWVKVLKFNHRKLLFTKGGVKRKIKLGTMHQKFEYISVKYYTHFVVIPVGRLLIIRIPEYYDIHIFKS